MSPVRFAVRRLEDRRVLDVTASFAVATGSLEVQLGADGDQALLGSDTSGNLSITDQDGNPVPITDGTGPVTVAIDDIAAVQVIGADGDQEVQFLTDLSPQDGLRVDMTVETTVITSSIDAAPASLLFESSVETRLDGDVALTGGDIQMSGPVTVRGNAAFASLVGDIRFTSRATLNSVSGATGNVRLDAATGSVFFNADVGATDPLGSLIVERADAGIIFGGADSTPGAANPIATVAATDGIDLGSGTNAITGGILFNGAASGLTLETSGGSVRLNGPTQLDGDVSIRTGSGAGNVLFTDVATVDAGVLGDSLEIDAGTGDVAFNAAIGSISPLDGLHVTSGRNVTFLQSVDATASNDDVSVTISGSLLVVDGAMVNAGGGGILVAADSGIQIGQLISTTLVRLDASAGAIVDGGDVGGNDIVAPAARLEARDGIGTANPIETEVPLLAAHNRESGGVRIRSLLGGGNGGTLTIGNVLGLFGITSGPADATNAANLGGDIEIINEGSIIVEGAVQNNTGGNTTLQAELPFNDMLPADLVLNEPVQNRGGDGWMLLQAAGDLVINDSLPEFVGGDPSRPFPDAEVSVENEGVIRGQAGGEVTVANGPTNYAIIRTHAERFPDPPVIPMLPARFRDPATFPAPADDPLFYVQLEAALASIRNAVAPQATNVAPLLEIEAVDRGGSTIDAQGRAILMVTIGDAVHLERNFALTVDWGDGTVETYSFPGNPTASRGFILASGTRINQRPDATITASLNSGETQPDGSTAAGVYFVHHTYTAPPDPDDPSKPVPVRAEIRYDVRETQTPAVAMLDAMLPATDSTGFNGIRFFRNTNEEIFSFDVAEFRSPGEGSFEFIKVVESEIIPVERREPPPTVVTSTPITSTSDARLPIESTSERVEQDTTAGYRLFFVVVDDVRGTESTKQFEVPLDALSDPIGLFTGKYRFPDGRTRTFPDGHYRLYLEDLQTERMRLILDIHLSEGRVVPPNFRDGAVEGQPQATVEERVGPPEEARDDSQNGALPAEAAPEDNAVHGPASPAVTHASLGVPPGTSFSHVRRANGSSGGIELIDCRPELDAGILLGCVVLFDAKVQERSVKGLGEQDLQRWLGRAARVTRRLRRDSRSPVT